MTTKAELKMLEKVFAAEIEGRLFQSKAKIMMRLEEKGLVRRTRKEYPADRFGPIVVEGWGQTILGNMTYCFSCGDDGDSSL